MAIHLKFRIHLKAYWRATHPPERTQATTISRNLPSQEVSPTGDVDRDRMGPPGMHSF